MKVNKGIKSLLALTLVTGMVSGCSKSDDTIEKTNEAANASIQIETNQATGNTLTKDETVYVLCNGSGQVDQIIVSDWIKNGSKEDTINDVSNLSNIEVTKGETTYSMEGNRTIWDANSGDVYYQGENDDKNSLPVGLSVTYQLDGKDITLEQLEGKSGKLTIQIDYSNYTKQTVDLDGKKTELYVPFIMLTGCLLDETYSNVSVSNGKLVELEGKTAVMGFAMPGLSEDLGTIGDKLDLPSSVSIEADVENVTTPTLMTIASNSLLNEVDFDKVDSLDDMKDQLNELDDGFKQLIDGSSSLYDGMSTLLTSANTLVEAIGKLATGTNQLKQGAASLYDGSITLRDNLNTLASGASQLEAGAESLNSGLNTLSSNSESLKAGAKQVYDSLIANVQDSLNENASQLSALGITTVPTLTSDNFETVLNQIITQLDESNIVKAIEAKVMEQVVAAVDSTENQAAIQKGVEEAVRNQVNEQVKEAVKQQVLAAVLNQAGYTQEQYEGNEQIRQGIDQSVEAMLPTYEEVINQKTEEQMNSESVQAIIQKNIEQQRQSLISSNYETQLNAYLNSTEGKTIIASANATAIKLAKAKASIVAYRDQFYTGLVAYVNGVDQAVAGSSSLLAGVQSLSSGASQLYNGSVSLSEGVAQLQAGLDTLDNGVAELNEKVQALPTGIEQLKDGTMQLSDGIQQIYDEGISKIIDLVNNDLADYIDRFKKIQDLSISYDNYSGKSENMDGSVKFIFKTGE